MTSASNLVRFPGTSSAPSAAPPAAPARPLERAAVPLVAPTWLSPAGRTAFRKAAAWLELEAPDWLGAIDADALGLAVEHLAIAVAASKAMRGPGGHYRPLELDVSHGRERRKHPAAQVFRDSTAAYLAVVRELGLTPRARRALEVAGGYGPGPEDDDPAGLFDA